MKSVLKFLLFAVAIAATGTASAEADQKWPEFSPATWTGCDQEPNSVALGVLQGHNTQPENPHMGTWISSGTACFGDRTIGQIEDFFATQSFESENHEGGLLYWKNLPKIRSIDQIGDELTFRIAHPVNKAWSPVPVATVVLIWSFERTDDGAKVSFYFDTEDKDNGNSGQKIKHWKAQISLKETEQGLVADIQHIRSIRKKDVDLSKATGAIQRLFENLRDMLY